MQLGGGGSWEDKKNVAQGSCMVFQIKTGREQWGKKEESCKREMGMLWTKGERGCNLI